MTFDTRARRAAQGIHRAVEVMEMSSTKTPQRLTRFDQYREGKSRNKRIAAFAMGIAVPVVLLVAAVLVLKSDRNPSVPITTPSTSVTPTSVSGSTHTFKAPFTYTVPQSWALSGEGARYFSLDSTVVPGGHLIVLSGVRAGRLDCTNRPDLSVGTSSDAMTTWLSTHPALDATEPRPVRLGAASSPPSLAICTNGEPPGGGGSSANSNRRAFDAFSNRSRYRAPSTSCRGQGTPLTSTTSPRTPPM